LAALGEGQARTALSRALNHEGNKGRTKVKRELVKQTGIKYGAVDKAMATIRATPATLTYTLKARGDETNVAWFGGVQRRKGVSAAPWKKRRIFRHAFIVPRFGRAYERHAFLGPFHLFARFCGRSVAEVVFDGSDGAASSGASS
jgi:hypothetical protein